MSQDPLSSPGQQPAAMAAYGQQPTVPQGQPVTAVPPAPGGSPGEVSYDGGYPDGAPVASPSTYLGPVVGGTEKNWMGIVAIIGAFVMPLAGVVFGHLGLSAAKKGEADNRGLALAGLIISYVGIGFGVIATILYVALFAATASSGDFVVTTP